MAIAVAAAALATPAAADTPLTLVQATLTSRVPVHATTGTRFALTWTFANDSGSVDPGLGGAMMVFVRLVSRDGKATTTAAASVSPRTTSTPALNALLHPSTHYRAVAKVPRGGVGRIEIGFRLHALPALFALQTIR